MEKLEFQPAKSKNDFRKNYLLHDLAESAGKNLLIQWDIDFKDFGEDRRYERVWEKGTDKPDTIIKIDNIKAFIDWKGKHKPKWKVNKRAVKAYEQWGEKFNMPVIIVFFMFNKNKDIIDRRFAFLGKHQYHNSSSKAWDKNETVEFTDELPFFNNINFRKFLR